MDTQFSKSDNGLTLDIPAAMAKEMNLKADLRACLSYLGNGIVIVRVPSRQRYTLDEMVASLKEAAPLEGLDWGVDVGKEILEDYDGREEED